MAYTDVGVPPRDQWDFDFYDEEEKVELNEDFNNVIVVDNLPVVKKKKYEKLTDAIAKRFSEELSYDIPRKFTFHPFDEESGKSLGYAFIQFRTAADAMKAKKAQEGVQFSEKWPPMAITEYSDFKKFEEYPEEYKEPSAEDMDQKSNLNTWLLDPKSRDQFVLRHDDKTEVFWNEPVMKNVDGRYLDCPGKDDKGARAGQYPRTAQYVQWSPNGSYLATFHAQGIRIYGGPDYQPITRFSHEDVLHISFSPCEKYLVTFNAKEYEKTSETQCIMIWDVRTGQIARGFRGGWLLENRVGQWPLIKWSHDDKYFAKMEEDCLFIYDTENGMALLDKRRLRLPGIDEFEWSPTDHIIAFTVPEKENHPAKIELRAIPSREIVGEKHWLMVSSLTMRWQERGDYLAVKVAKRTKTNKPKGTSFVVFRVHERNIPKETIDLIGEIIEDKIKPPPKLFRGQQPPKKEPPPVKVIAFAFEPIGRRFAIITMQDGSERRKITFYRIDNKKIKSIIVLKNRMANRLYWSPMGGWILIAGLGELNGQLEFFNANGKGPSGKVEGISATQTFHEMCIDAEWDPAGRYIATFVVQPIHRGGDYRAVMDNGYKIWSNYGQLLIEMRYESLYQFSWRPRPASLLTNEHKREIQKSLKSKYTLRFEKDDDEAKLAALDETERNKQELVAKFKEYRQTRKRDYEKQRKLRQEMRGYKTDDENEYDEVYSDVEEQFEMVEEVEE